MNEGIENLLKTKISKALCEIEKGNYSFRFNANNQKDDLSSLLNLLDNLLQNIEESEKKYFQKNEELTKIRQQYRTVFENVADAFYIFNAASMNIVDANQKACEQLGYSHDEIMSVSLTGLFPGVDDYAKLRQMLEKVDFEKVITFNANKKRRDGSVFPVEIKLSSVENKSKNYILLFFQDITERLKTVETLLMTQFSIDKANDAIFWLEPKGQFIYANDAACKSLGYTKEELLKKTIFDVDTTFSKETWEKHWTKNKKRKFALIETKHKTKDGRIVPVEVSINVMSFGGKEYHSSFVRDITERKKTEEMLLLTQHAFDSASIGILRSDNKGKVIGVNDQICKNLKYSKEELLGMYIWDLDPEFPKNRWMAHRGSLRKNGSIVFQTVHRRKDGTIFPVEITSNYREFKGNAFSLSFIKDITEQKLAESALKESEYLLKESQRVARLGHYTFDAVTGHWKGSQVLYDILGVDVNYRKDINGWLKIVHPDYVSQMYNYLTNDVLIKHKKFDREYKIVRINDKHVRWVHGLGELKINNHRKVIQMIGTIQDITERKQAEENLKDSLRDKEVLLKELYHRTKNNMQVIRSMLAMQSAHITDEEIRKIFLETENRILTMSLVHQKLYQSHNLSSIDLKEYIEELVHLLIKSYNVSEERISTELNLESIFVLIDTAIPCGLIINELLSNSLKHGFPENRGGVISVSLKQKGGDKIELIFSDNGIGVAKDFDFKEQETLGVQSIVTIAEHQLQGIALFETDKGVSCNIRFNNSLYTPRV